MFSKILSEVTTNLDNRFKTSIFIPTFVFCGAIIYLIHINDMSDYIDEWNALGTEIQFARILIFLFIVTFLSYLLDGNRDRILRIYEGSWEDFPIFSSFFDNHFIYPEKKKQHQLILQVNDLQATRIEYELKYLEVKEDAIRFKKYIDDDPIKNHLDGAEKCLDDAEKCLDQAHNIHAWFFPDLKCVDKIVKSKASCGCSKVSCGLKNKAKNFISIHKNSAMEDKTSIQKGIEGARYHLNEASKSLDKAKIEILKERIKSHPEKSVEAAIKTSGKLHLSTDEIGKLMEDLANPVTESDILQKKLFINLQKKLFTNEDKMKSLKKDVDKFTVKILMLFIASCPKKSDDADTDTSRKSQLSDNTIVKLMTDLAITKTNKQLSEKSYKVLCLIKDMDKFTKKEAYDNENAKDNSDKIYNNLKSLKTDLETIGSYLSLFDSETASGHYRTVLENIEDAKKEWETLKFGDSANPDKNVNAAKEASGKLESSKTAIDYLIIFGILVTSYKLPAKEEGYKDVKTAEDDSKEISKNLESLETELKAIGGDLSSFKSENARGYYDNVLKNIEDAKEEWDKLKIFENLTNTDYPGESGEAAREASEKLESSKNAINELITNLENASASSDILRQLSENKDAVQSLKTGMDKFREEERYKDVEKAESESKEISENLSSLKISLKAIDSDSFKSEAIGHYNTVLEKIEGAIKEWDKLKLQLSDDAIVKLMTDLAKTETNSDILQKRLFIDLQERQCQAAKEASGKLQDLSKNVQFSENVKWWDKLKAKVTMWLLIKQVNKFTNEKGYEKLEKAESDSKEIYEILKYLETNYIGNSNAKTVNDNIKGAKKEWDTFKKFEFLASVKEKRADYKCECDLIYKHIYFHYPPVDMLQKVMPTCLGNVMKSAEMYVKKRYNADAVFFLSKLYHCMEKDWVDTLTNTRGSLDMMILISFLSSVLITLWSFDFIILHWSGAQSLQFITIFGILLGIGWFAYRGAITYAVIYSDMIRSTFDLYRDKLVSSMELKAPESLKEEREFWEELNLWLYLNKQPSKIKYSKSTKEESK